MNNRYDIQSTALKYARLNNNLNIYVNSNWHYLVKEFNIHGTRRKEAFNIAFLMSSFKTKDADTEDYFNALRYHFHMVLKYINIENMQQISETKPLEICQELTD